MNRAIAVVIGADPAEPSSLTDAVATRDATEATPTAATATGGVAGTTCIALFEGAEPL